MQNIKLIHFQNKYQHFMGLLYYYLLDNTFKRCKIDMEKADEKRDGYFMKLTGPIYMRRGYPLIAYIAVGITWQYWGICHLNMRHWADGGIMWVRRLRRLVQISPTSGMQRHIMRHWPDGGLMWVCRLRRRAHVSPTSGQCLNMCVCMPRTFVIVCPKLRAAVWMIPSK